jgi:hypothetical protein
LVLARLSAPLLAVSGCGLLEYDAGVDGGAAGAGAADEGAERPLPLLGVGSRYEFYFANQGESDVRRLWGVIDRVACSDENGSLGVSFLSAQDLSRADDELWAMGGFRASPVEVGRATEVTVRWLGGSIATEDPEVCTIDILRYERVSPERSLVEVEVRCPAILTFPGWNPGQIVRALAVPSSYRAELECV